jgi:hypothetical protein
MRRITIFSVTVQVLAICRVGWRLQSTCHKLVITTYSYDTLAILAPGKIELTARTDFRDTLLGLKPCSF